MGEPNFVRLTLALFELVATDIYFKHSFICSSNNNITRITKMVNALCNNYSPPLLSMDVPSLLPDTARGPLTPASSSLDVKQEQQTFHPFPPPSRLAQPEVAAELRNLGFGYRADFIQKTAKMLVDAHETSEGDEVSEPPEKWLVTLRDLPTTEARVELLKLMGVGRKVADCVLLMSLDKVCDFVIHSSFKAKRLTVLPWMRIRERSYQSTPTSTR